MKIDYNENKSMTINITVNSDVEALMLLSLFNNRQSILDENFSNLLRDNSMFNCTRGVDIVTSDQLVDINKSLFDQINTATRDIYYYWPK